MAASVTKEKEGLVQKVRRWVSPKRSRSNSSDRLNELDTSTTPSLQEAAGSRIGRWAGAAAPEAEKPKRKSRWVEALEKFVAKDEDLMSEEAKELEVQDKLRELMSRPDQTSTSGTTTAAAIPRFFQPRLRPESIEGHIQRLARLRFLRSQQEALLDTEELETLWLQLKQHASPAEDEDVPSERINYDDFCQAGERCVELIGPKCRRFFLPSVFLTFEADDAGCITILPLYLFAMRMVSLTQTRIDMCLFDSDGDGCLTAAEMEAYIGHLIPSLALLGSSELGPGGSFLNMYKRIAARKFFFFCDPQRRGKVSIRNVLLSPALSELMELRQETDSGDDTAASNWFSLSNAKRVYAMFMALDKECKGSISKEQLMAFGDGNLTDIFIERVFDCHLRRGKHERGNRRAMDLNNFLDFVLAMENQNSPQGLTYLFQCLDIAGKGYLAAPDIYTLFKSVHQKWVEGGNYDLVIEDVKDEIWDMVKPLDPMRITLDDLINCKQGGTIASMLIDVGGFWQHDNRETLAQQDQEEDNLLTNF